MAVGQTNVHITSKKSVPVCFAITECVHLLKTKQKDLFICLQRAQCHTIKKYIKSGVFVSRGPLS